MKTESAKKRKHNSVLFSPPDVGEGTEPQQQKSNTSDPLDSEFPSFSSPTKVLNMVDEEEERENEKESKRGKKKEYRLKRRASSGMCV